LGRRTGGPGSTILDIGFHLPHYQILAFSLTNYQIPLILVANYQPDKNTDYKLLSVARKKIRAYI
jgi:hypothetical protein